MQMGLIQERQDVNKLSVISLFRCVAMSFVRFDTYKSKLKIYTLLWALSTGLCSMHIPIAGACIQTFHYLILFAMQLNSVPMTILCVNREQ